MEKEIIGFIYGLSYDELDDVEIGSVVPVVGFTVYDPKEKKEKVYRLPKPIDTIYRG